MGGASLNPMHRLNRHRASRSHDTTSLSSSLVLVGRREWRRCPEMRWQFVWAASRQLSHPSLAPAAQQAVRLVESTRSCSSPHLQASSMHSFTAGQRPSSQLRGSSGQASGRFDGSGGGHVGMVKRSAASFDYGSRPWGAAAAAMATADAGSGSVSPSGSSFSVAGAAALPANGGHGRRGCCMHCTALQLLWGVRQRVSSCVRARKPELTAA